MAAERRSKQSSQCYGFQLMNLVICLISLDQSQQNEVTRINHCICTENNQNCLSSVSVPKNVIYHSEFDRESSLDKYSKSVVEGHNTRISFGRNNKGRSVSFQPDSKMFNRIMKADFRNALTVEIWLRFTEYKPYVFASILDLSFVKSYLKDNQAGHFLYH